MKTACTAFVVSLLLATSPAVAQPDEEEVELGEDMVEPPADSGEKGDLGDDFVEPALEDESPGGVEENPDDPRAVGVKRRAGEEEGAKDARGAYPLELVKRPLTLNGGMSEILLRVPTNFDPYYTAGSVKGSYGVTDKVEIALRYGLGAVDEDGFTEGKAVGVDAVYLINEVLAVQMSVPLLLDPLALGVTFGAPVKWRPFDKLAFVFGRDLVNIKLKEFVPDVDNAAVTGALAFEADRGTDLPKGDLRLLLGVIYQHSPNMAIMGESGFIATDFGTTDGGVPLLLSLIYSNTEKLDFGVRAGFTNLDEAKHHAGLSLFCAVRL